MGNVAPIQCRTIPAKADYCVSGPVSASSFKAYANVFAPQLYQEMMKEGKVQYDFVDTRSFNPHQKTCFAQRICPVATSWDIDHNGSIKDGKTLLIYPFAREDHQVVSYASRHLAWQPDDHWCTPGWISGYYGGYWRDDPSQANIQGGIVTAFTTAHVGEHHDSTRDIGMFAEFAEAMAKMALLAAENKADPYYADYAHEVAENLQHPPADRRVYSIEWLLDAFVPQKILKQSLSLAGQDGRTVHEVPMIDVLFPSLDLEIIDSSSDPVCPISTEVTHPIS